MTRILSFVKAHFDRRFIIAAVCFFVTAGIVVGAFFYLNRQWTYTNFVEEFRFEANGVGTVDVLSAAAYLVYPVGAVGAEAKTRLRTEADFYNARGVTIKPLRHIPGKKEVFDLFISQEFAPRLFEERKFSSKKFQTDRGFDAYRLQEAGSEIVHIVINTPLAYWFSGREEAFYDRPIFDSFAPVEEARGTKAARTAAVLDTFMLRLKDRQYEKALQLATADYRAEFTKKKLADWFGKLPFLLDRSFISLDILMNWRTAKVTGVLEDAPAGRYAKIEATLIKTWPWQKEWKIEEMKMSRDLPGLPSARFAKTPRDKERADEILTPTSPPAN